jgi:hypothetical protein
MTRRFRTPREPRWVGRARKLVDEGEPLSKQSVLRLLKRFTETYDRHVKALLYAAEQVTTDEGDRKATEQSIGLSATEIIEMVYDEMITQARLALRTPAENSEV